MRGNGKWSSIDFIVIAAVLGIMMTTAGPRLSQAGTEKKISRLIDGLHQMRVQLDLYRVYHGDNLPCCDSFENFKNELTRRAGGYSPNIRKIPVNPFNGLNTVRFDGEAAGIGKAGWRLDTKSGLFQADYSPEYANL